MATQPIKFDHQNIQIDVNADGTFVREIETLISLQTEQGAKSVNQLPLPFSEKLESLDVLEAYTLKNDGRRLNVPKDRIFTQQSPASSGAPTFSDIKIKMIVFSDVAAGDKIAFKAKWTQTKPTFTGHFYYAINFPRTAQWDLVKLAVSRPTDYALNIEAFDFDTAAPVQRGSRTFHQWEYKNLAVVPPTGLAVAEFDYAPRIFISSFKSWSDFASAYQEPADRQSKVTSIIRDLAEQITKGVPDRKEQVRMLHKWVARNIRYVAIHMGTGTVLPHTADEVLSNRYGDCKDHVTLYEALLDAKGIKSTPALVNQGNSYQLSTAPTLGVLNHVITYIPEFDVYVDSTDPFVAFGALPLEVSDKPVVHTKGFSEIKRTPPTNARTNKSAIRAEIRVDSDGNATAKSELIALGAHAGALRALTSSLPPQDIEMHVRRNLGASGQSGTGSVKWQDPYAAAESFVINADIKLENTALIPGPAGLTIPSGYRIGRSLKSIVDGLSGQSLKIPYPCAAETLNEETTVFIPATAKVLAIPKGISIKNTRATYTAEYRREGNTIIVKRHYETKPNARNLCSGQDGAEAKEFWKQISRDLKSQIVYE
jgi:hypothetical protein